MEHLEKYLAVNEPLLREQYPLGYTILYTSGNSVYEPRKNALPIDADWRHATAEMSEDSVAITVPYLEFPGNNRFENLTLSIPRNTHSPTFLIQAFGVGIWAEAIVDTRDGVVGVVGMRSAPRAR
jgi:hypothetical protein